MNIKVIEVVFITPMEKKNKKPLLKYPSSFEDERCQNKQVFITNRKNRNSDLIIP